MGLLLRGIWKNILKGHHTNQHVIGSKSFCNSVSSSITRTPPDTTMLALRTSVSTSDVLATVQRHLPTVTHKHLLQALKTLFDLQKDIGTNAADMIRDPAFTIVCQHIKKHARKLDTYELVDAIKILTFLNVPVDSLLLQTLLQLVRTNINDLNIRQVMFLDFLLKKLNVNNHLCDALLLALPLVFQIHLPLELDQDDLPLLRDMLIFSSQNKLPDRCINNIVTGLLLHDKSFDVNTARSVLWSLIDVNCTAEVYLTRYSLLNLCYEVLSENIDALSYDDLLRTLGRIKSRVVKKYPEYYNQKFLDAAADYVIDNKIDIKRSIYIARILSRIAHTHLGLAEYICRLVSIDPTALATAPTNLLFGFVNFLCNNYCIPEKSIWDEIKRQLTANRVLDANNPALPWTKFTLELAALGYYDDRVLAKVFSQDFLNEILSKSNHTLDYLQILMLFEAVNVFHDKRYELSEEVLEKAKSLYPVQSMTSVVADMLGRGLGGHDYVAQNVVLPSGIVIDLVVCLDNDGLIKLNAGDEHKTPIESLNIPSSALTVCILNFGQGCYAMNSSRLRGNFHLILDILEKKDFAVIPLKFNDWYHTPDKEKIPYLLREIDFKAKEMGFKLSAKLGE